MHLDFSQNNCDRYKRVALRFDGNLDRSGFKVTLEISIGDRRPYREDVGFLPACPQLAQTVRTHWQDKYRNVGAPYTRKKPLEQDYRIKPKRTVYNGRIQRLRDCQQSAETLKSEFATWLSSSDFQAIELCLREELKPEDIAQITLRTDCRDVQKLPWHDWQFLRRYPKLEISLSPLVAGRAAIDRRPRNSAVKILAILGHSEGIDLDRDRQFLDDLPNADVSFLVEPKRQKINDRLWEQPWDIIFFAGHSETVGDTGKIYINPEESLELQDIWYGLRKAVDRGLQLAIFNSCDGLGLVQKMDDWQIPIAVVMRELVPDRVAQTFLRYFLTRFVAGIPFHLAVREAREQLQGMEGDFPCASWLPMICQSPSVLDLSWNNLFETPEPETVESPQAERETAGVASVPPVRRQRRRWHSSFHPLLAIALFGVLGLHFGVRPKVAEYFNERGADFINELHGFSMKERSSLPPWVAAKRNFKIAFMLDRNNREILVNMGYVYEDMSEFSKAQYFYRRAHLKHDPTGCSNLGRLHIIKNELDRAERYLQQCLHFIEGDDPKERYFIRKNQAWLELERNRPKLAIDFGSDAIAAAPGNFQAHCIMAIANQEQKYFSLAVEHARQCLLKYEEHSSSVPLLEEQDWLRRNREIISHFSSSS